MKFITPNGSFYEKIIDISFFEKSDSTRPSYTIKSSENNFKPRIDISGTMLTNSLTTNIELRILNGHISFNNKSFQRVEITAGYSYENTGVVSGNITHAYVESPGPDGITVFFILLGEQIFKNYRYIDNTLDENGKPYGGNFYYRNDNRNATYADILSFFAEKIQGLSYIEKIIVPDDIGKRNWHTPIQMIGTVVEMFQQLINVRLGLSYSINGNIVNIFDQTVGSNGTQGYKINRFSSAPIVNVQDHINFQSPWIPGLRPGDYIAIEPGFMKTTFGGWASTQGQADVPLIYIIFKIDFDFSTTENTNVMIVDCLAPSTNITYESDNENGNG